MKEELENIEMEKQIEEWESEDMVVMKRSAMPVQTKAQREILDNITHSWECPVCCEKIEGEVGETPNEFAQRITDNGMVAFQVLNYMEGTFCMTCVNNPEVNESSL